MRIIWSEGSARGMWLGPAMLGAIFIAIGIAIWRFPELLAYAVAALFVLIGVVLLAVAWQMRGRVRYRRMDMTSTISDDEE
jgi:hypothetical protein